MAKFDGRSNPYEHVTSTKTHMAIIGAPDSLKLKLLSRISRDATLRLYIDIPQPSISSYQQLVKNIVHHFVASRHKKMSIMKLFNIRQGPSESFREYLARFNEATIRIVPSNQEMFMKVFHNDLKAGNFNESLSQRPTSSLI